MIAVTGDDEDNMLICQVAKEKYMVEQIIARVNNPRNKQWFELLGIRPVVSATDLILRLIEHEVPEYGLVHLLDLPRERLEIIELLLGEGSPVAGKRVDDLELPEGSLLISVLRDGTGLRPRARDGARGRRRGPRRARPGGRGGSEDLLRPRRGRRRLGRAEWRTARSTSCWSAAGWPRRTARRSCAGGARRARSCSSGASRTPPYERPPLSKEYLRGESAREDAFVNPPDWYEENDVELLTGRA